MHNPTQIHISRAFDAPRELVYRAFTDPDHFSTWWGPAGNTVLRDEIEFDVRRGGYQRWTEVAAGDPAVRVRVRVDLSDVAEGHLLEGVMHVNGHLPGGFDPFESAFRIEFHDEPPDRTRLEVRQWLPANLARPSEQGWDEAFTKLDVAVATNHAITASGRN